ncbi:MAG: hypothetical protein AAGH19_05840 [Pseudomonadota bacterium]
MSRWLSLALALKLLVGCSAPQSTLPNWDTMKGASRTNDAATDGGDNAAQAYGVVYHVPPPLLWMNPYEVNNWYGYATIGSAGTLQPLDGQQGASGAVRSLYYPWYGWSPRQTDDWPYPWYGYYGYGSSARSFVYTPPFGDADGSPFLFASPSAGVPARGGFQPTPLLSSSSGRALSARSSVDHDSARQRTLRMSPRLEDYQAPQDLRRVPGASPARTGALPGVYQPPVSSARPGGVTPSRPGTTGSRPRR